jgi:hypothetical protein
MVILSIIGQYVAAISLVVALLIELESLDLFGEKKESKESRKKEVQRKLSEIYQPIHFMFDDLKRFVNFGDANGIGFMGGYAPVNELQSYDKVREIFIYHGYELPNASVVKWKQNLQLTLWKGRQCLYVNTDFGALFRELEAKYQELKKQFDSLSTEK